MPFVEIGRDPNESNCKREGAFATRSAPTTPDFGFDPVQAASELAKLRSQIARAARQLGELIAGFKPIMPAGSDRVIDCERGKRSEPRERRFRAGKAKTPIDHGAEQGGDQHHADCNQKGANTHHVTDQPLLDPRRMLPVSTSRRQAASSEIAHSKRGEGAAALL